MTTTTLASYLNELKALPREPPIEPDLKEERKKHDKKIREDQDIVAGAVLQAVLEPGEGDEVPTTGDLVLVQYSIKDEDDDVLYSTRSSEGGSGSAFAFQLEAGCRAPRGLEIVLKGMHRKERRVVKLQPSYGYAHEDCGLDPPSPNVPISKLLTFDLQLLDWVPAGQVRHVGQANDIYLQTLQEGNSWETPRAPFEVTFHLTLRLLAYDGIQQTGRQYFTTTDEGSGGKNGGSGTVGQQHRGPLTLQLGQGLLPAGLEEAMGHVSKEETVLVTLPARAMGACKGPLPAPPGKAPAQVEARVSLLSMVQVRDMTGTGEVTKKRLREGTGEFPMDCPLHDTTVTVHFKARPVRGGVPGPWAYDSRQQLAESAGGKGADASAQGAPVEFDTGCGEMPEGLEMAVKLMVPGELAAVVCAPRYAYGQGTDAQGGAAGGGPSASPRPAGIEPGDTVEFEVELLSFIKEGHWQVMSMAERYELAERMKAKGNELYRTGKYKFARARYERLSRLLESTRDFETDEEVRRIEALRFAALSNLAAVAFSMQDFADAVRWCNKALEYEPESAKVLFRRAKAHSHAGEAEEAEDSFAATLAVVKAAKAAAAAAAEGSTPSALAKAAGGTQAQPQGDAVSEGDPAAGAASIADQALAKAIANAAGVTEEDVESERKLHAARIKAAAQKQRRQFRNFFDK